ncbi:glycoside hydrolase family 25 protein [Oscillospiraceae bacterium 21-37]|uniref:glycoside hydrolase family 25 protein n=1 Tax=Acutalibacter sp. JLR.KK004 TaxID=3112622 RepID=UPI002FF3EFBE
MGDTGRKTLFLGATALLVVVIIVISAVMLARGPRTSSVELLEKDGNTAKVNDMYEGDMTIPYYDIRTSNYNPEDFEEKNGVVTYAGDSFVGINVSQKAGEIDWNAVAESGVEFAMIRVGYRGNDKGRISLDSNFEANITGATEAGLPVGVYFYSKAVTDTEAEEEANFVLEQIRPYQMTYPVAIFWEYDRKDSGEVDEKSRTVRCNGDQVTGFIQTFLKKIKTVGYKTAFYADKKMGYESLDLSRLTEHDMWYAEYQPAPSFYYDYKMWQYTKDGEVPGISKPVPITISLKEYKP